jgi:hypothetical protein
MLKNRRALGEIISALLLLFVVSSASVLLYSLTVSTTNTQISEVLRNTGREANEVKERFEIIAVSNITAPNHNFSIYNYGQSDIILDRVYVSGVLESSSVSVAISQLELGFVIVDLAGYNMSDPIIITIVSERGVSYSYVYKE